MNLLTNEHIILNSNENKVILTNMRLHMSDKAGGQLYRNTIFLEDISSVEVRYKNNIIFLILSGIVLLGWLQQSANNYNTNGQGTSFLAIAVISFLLYLFTRQQIISVTPNGGKAISFAVSNMATEQVEYFIDKVQIAKAERLNEIYKL